MWAGYLFFEPSSSSTGLVSKLWLWLPRPADRHSSSAPKKKLAQYGVGTERVRGRICADLWEFFMEIDILLFGICFLDESFYSRKDVDYALRWMVRNGNVV